MRPLLVLLAGVLFGSGLMLAGMTDPQRVLAGSAIFGVGWGLSGICPGPGLMLLASAGLPAFVFVGAMSLGMLLAAVFIARRTG